MLGSIFKANNGSQVEPEIKFADKTKELGPRPIYEKNFLKLHKLALEHNLRHVENNCQILILSVLGKKVLGQSLRIIRSLHIRVT